MRPAAEIVDPTCILLNEHSLVTAFSLTATGEFGVCSSGRGFRRSGIVRDLRDSWTLVPRFACA